MSVLAVYLYKIALFKLFVIRCYYPQSELLLVIGLHVSKGQRPNKF